jgi:DNA polymerase-1
MQTYCEQDVEVTHALWRHIEKQQYAEEAVQLEHDFRWVIHLQEQHGFRFNVEAAGKLHAQLVGRKEFLITELQKLVPPTRIEMKTPEYYFSRDPFGNEIVRAETKTAVTAELKRLGLKVKDFPPQPGPNKFKLDHFNPGSRQQVAEYLISKGWKPAKLTDTGQPQIDETVLEGIDFPEAKLLKEYFIVGKLLSQLAEGDNAWLKLARKGRIHGQMNTNGAVTGRAAHFKPNVGQVPSVMVGKDKHPLLGYEGRFGWECRSLFMADEGQVLVGADASGLSFAASPTTWPATTTGRTARSSRRATYTPSTSRPPASPRVRKRRRSSTATSTVPATRSSASTAAASRPRTSPSTRPSVATCGPTTFNDSASRPPKTRRSRSLTSVSPCA